MCLYFYFGLDDEAFKFDSKEELAPLDSTGMSKSADHLILIDFLIKIKKSFHCNYISARLATTFTASATHISSFTRTERTLHKQYLIFLSASRIQLSSPPTAVTLNLACILIWHVWPHLTQDAQFSVHHPSPSPIHSIFKPIISFALLNWQLKRWIEC